ncbi:hypothetical protein Cylst_2289 [Cylindrospermum stagnale PCC 7417]|uniref:eCIS core domain-containing protein n=1 Tax=Cylindrospermum stagnale PCC 7417 TaxID=56107 RepID=K9WXH9_9NOST|nr:DUF4157 domain-containing protein [Cylindrospermum stagnale]AFZ24519.1 hypothetical protein Cylst_2289 [Cylindrospermum stagnale PCC 7417]
MAEQVMSMDAPTANSQAIGHHSEEPFNSIQQQPLVRSVHPIVRRQQELNRIQRQPTTSIHPLIKRQMEFNQNRTQTKPITSTNPLIQRFVQRAEGNIKSQENPSLESRLANQKGSGSPLDEQTRSFMEPRFGNDFSSVRVHTDSPSVQMNQELEAQAFTHGQDVFFGAGKYNPGADDGKRLLAHELTHVVQQTGAVQPKKQVERIQAKNLLGQIPEIPLNKEQLQPPQLGETAKKSLPTKNLLGQIPEIPLNKEQLPGSQLAETAKKALPAKNLLGQIPEIPLNKEQLPGSQLAETSAAKTPEIGQDTAKPATTPQGAQPEAKQANPGVDALKVEEKKNEAIARSALPKAIAPTLPDVEQTAQSAPQVESADVDQAGSAATTPDVSAGGGGGEEAAAVDAGADQEVEEIATGTEGLQLESSDRAEVMGSLAEVSQGGGAAAPSGGGGGGAAIADKPAPPVPDVSQSEPSQALASIGKLPPAQLLGALGGVSAAVGNIVGKQRAELAANPPQMEQPTGAPTKEGAAGSGPNPQAATPKPVEKTPEGQAQPVPQPQPITLPPAPAVKAVSPPVQGDAEGKLSANDAQAMKASLRQIPTSDPNLQVNAGTPPPLELTGNADPQQAQEQKAKLDQGVTEAHTQGQKELAQPMGENEIYPQIVPETLKAEGIGGNAAAPEAPVIQGIVGDDAVSIIAQQEHGAEIQAAVAQAQGQMAAKQQEHTTQVAQEKASNQQEIAKLQQENTFQQSAERSKAQAEVQKQKEDWNKEQTDLVAKSRTDAEAEIAKGNKEVEQEQTQAETKASLEIEKGNTEAEAARQKGETEAEQERSKGEKDSGGILGWFADKAKAFFDGIKQAIQKAFEIARAAVKAAIETAQKLATAVIEAARQAIVSVIKRVGDALIALGDVLLAAFPEIRDRFRNAIKATVQAAEAAVNALAQNLKQGVQAALNLLGKGLDAALGLLEKGYLFAVDIASKAVQGAISVAKAAVDALGTFAVLIKDIALNPGQWLSNLGSGAKDGVQNHLWGAFQTAVQAWFGQKVEEVLGLGMTVWNVLNQGGIKVAEVGAMAWEGIKSAIPPTLIQLLIEKVVSMIIPAAGTVMLIIEGLQAAWGTVGRILQAMEKFVTFLKAVKSGQSGPQFAEMLAAAGVVLIDFVSNWLLKRLRGAASKVAAKVREIAKKIGRKLGKVKDKLFGKKGGKGSKGKGREGDLKGNKENREEQDRKNKDKVEQAARELQPKVNALLGSGVSGIRLRAQLAIWRIQHGLSRLYVDNKKGADHFDVVAQVNPTAKVTEGEVLDVKSEVEKAKGSLFRGDGFYQQGDPIGFQLDSPEANTADIQTPWEHVQDKDNKKHRQSSRYTSFATDLKAARKFAEAVIGQQGKKVIKKSKILKAAWEALQQLETQGIIRIYTPENVKTQMEAHEEKEVRHNAKNVYKLMTNNNEVLIEGQIPGEILRLAK